MHHLLIDENNFPSSSLIFLLDLMGLAHDYSLKSIVRMTQERWLQSRKERWHFEPREEHRLNYILPFLNTLGCIEPVFAKKPEYDYVLVLGGYHTRIQSRINHLIHEWERGVRFRRLVFLTGERFLDSDTEIPFFNLNEREASKECTETQLMLHIWEKSTVPSPLKNLPFTLVDTPKKISSATLSRPTTKDTVLKWLSFTPKPGKCLFISSQPFIGYQHSVITTYLPDTFTAETVGDYTEKNLPLCVYLDNLTRWLYQEQLRKKI